MIFRIFSNRDDTNISLSNGCCFEPEYSNLISRPGQVNEQVYQEIDELQTDGWMDG